MGPATGEMFLIVFAAMEQLPDLKAAIRDAALTLGFDAVGFAKAELAAESRAHLADLPGAGISRRHGLAASARRRSAATRATLARGAEPSSCWR